MGKNASTIINSAFAYFIYPIAKLFYIFDILSIQKKYDLVLRKDKELKLINIPRIFLEILIIAEDKKYYSHKGVDLFAIFRSTICNYKGFHQGGSTLTQQYIRVLVNDYSNNITRKIKEIFLALLLNSKFNKNELLIKYLSIAYYGYNLQGIKCFIQESNESLENLKLHDIALIIATLKYPKSKYYNKEREQRTKVRRNYILRNYYHRYENKSIFSLFRFYLFQYRG